MKTIRERAWVAIDSMVYHGHLPCECAAKRDVLAQIIEKEFADLAPVAKITETGHWRDGIDIKRQLIEMAVARALREVADVIETPSIYVNPWGAAADRLRERSLKIEKESE